MTRIVGLVPMRHHSQRVSGKNYRLLAGRPLFHHILATLQAVPEIDEVVVDTDSEVIKTGLRERFPQVRILDRPGHLRADDIPMNDILIHDTEQVEANFYLQTHSTNPLLESGTVSRAVQRFLASYPAHDSLFSVTRLQARLYDQSGNAINHDPRELVQTQALPPVYQENSCLYLFTRADLVARHHRIGVRPLMFEIAPDEAWDIDSELDFAICEFLMTRGNGGGKAV